MILREDSCVRRRLAEAEVAPRVKEKGRGLGVPVPVVVFMSASEEVWWPEVRFMRVAERSPGRTRCWRQRLRM